MYKKYIKRILDIVLSIIILILLIPLFAIIAILIKKEDKGKIIYRQERTGKNGKKFVIYKFRTMNSNETTKIGKVLRKTGIDELPQLINVLKGEMSLIGPRPWITDYYKNFNKNQKKRVDVLPGIIGLAQLKGNEIDVFKKIDYDLEYIKKISFITDLKIIIKSIKLIIKNNHNEITQEEISKEIKQLQTH